MGLSLELQKKLASELEGEVDFSDLTRALFSTDASMYKIQPLAVAFPHHIKDVILLTEFCAQHRIPIIPRGAGSGLAGQAIGKGIIMDMTRHMNNILKVDTKNRTVTLQPGINLNRANSQLEQYGLTIGPDPASGEMCTLGGMMGTNAKGARSIKYGKTSDNIIASEVVLSDGSHITVQQLSKNELHAKLALEGIEGDIYRKVHSIVTDFKKEIAAQFPKISNNSCGYNLKDITHNGFDLNKLLCGSEGTLATTVSITLALVPIPKERGGVLLFYKTLEDAMQETTKLLAKKPDAVELIDNELIALAKNHDTYKPIVQDYPKGTKAALLVEVSGNNQAMVKKQIIALIATSQKKFAHIEAYQTSELGKLWKLRKSGEPILMSRTDDYKYYPFVEDSCVDPSKLKEYVIGFKKVFKKHGTTAAYYGHASRGLLHIRPLINLKTVAGIDTMHAIAQDIAQLIFSLEGTISGEHGDGLARTEFIRQQYGEEIFSLFKDIKATFDPHNIFNPGKIVGDVSMKDNLRYGPQYASRFPQSALHYNNHTNLEQAAELCHGCATCKKDDGIMCPTYMAEPQEFLSTRGRANAINRALCGDLPKEYSTSEEFKEQILDMCIGCKGCIKDCPSNVDMARLKSEFLYHYQKKNGRPLLYRLVGATRAMSKYAQKIPFGRFIMGSHLTQKILQLLGFDKRRQAPVVEKASFASQFKTVANSKTPHKVVLFADCFTNFYESKVARAGVEVLQKVGCHVELAKTGCCGRVKLSTGDIKGAQKDAQNMVQRLFSYVQNGYSIVSFESSCVTMLQDDYKDLIEGKEMETIRTHSFEIMEYLAHLKEKGVAFNITSKKQHITYHGHCHSKARNASHYAADMLNLIPETTCNEIESTCCGMAGFFGYTHYDMSHKIGSMTMQKIQQNKGDAVAASGYSCRCQLKDFATNSKHPIEFLNEVLH